MHTERQETQAKVREEEGLKQEYTPDTTCLGLPGRTAAPERPRFNNHPNVYRQSYGSPMGRVWDMSSSWRSDRIGGTSGDRKKMKNTQIHGKLVRCLDWMIDDDYNIVQYTKWLADRLSKVLELHPGSFDTSNSCGVFFWTPLTSEQSWRGSVWPRNDTLS